LPNSTLAGASKKSAESFKLNKDRITVLVCVNVDGSHKLKLSVAGKFKKPRYCRNTTHIPVIHDSQENARTVELFQDRFVNHFVPAVNENLRKQGLPQYSKAIYTLAG
jgi:hypothetical protein